MFWLKKRLEAFHAQSGLSDESPKGALGELTMIRDREAAMRRLMMANDDVTPRLVVDNVANLLECSVACFPETTGKWVTWGPPPFLPKSMGEWVRCACEGSRDSRRWHP